MRKLIFDIETDGLLDTVSRMHVLVCKDINSKEIFSFKEGELGWKDLFLDSELIGHNIIGYDLLVLKKLFNYEHNSKVFDTLLYSQILNFNRFPNMRHNLETWGKSLDFNKIEFHDWSKYSEEMLEYCKRDVELTERVYLILDKEYQDIFKSNEKIAIYIEAEHYAAQWNAEAELAGFPFKSEKAKLLLGTLGREMQLAYDALNDKLGNRSVIIDKTPEGAEVKQPKWTKEGFYHKHISDWFGVDPCSGHPEEEQPIAGAYCRVGFRALSIDSTDDMKLFLFRNGWKPTEYNFVKDKITGKRRRTSPKITEESLEFLGGNGKLYLDFLTVRSRHSIVTTWLKEAKDNRVHGSAILIGTPSMRARHNIIVNVPSVDSAYGKEVRELFCSDDGWDFIGADSSGNQARGLAHLLKNDEYIDLILRGDVHQYNADILTKVLSEMNVKHVVPRGVAKRILYAFLFGASGKKLWSYIFGAPDSAKGDLLKEGFTQAVPGFKNLLDRLDRIYKITSRSGNGYIPSLVGNKIFCDSPHKLLVYALQAIEKITCSTALMLTAKELKAKNIPYQPLIYYHDEIDFQVPKEYSKTAAEISTNAFREGPKLYGINIMDGKSIIGENWKDCH